MLRLRILPAFALMLALVASTTAQEKKDPPKDPKETAKEAPKDPKEAPKDAGAKSALAWKFEKDKPFFQEMTTKTTQSMKVMGMDVNQVQEQTFYFKWTPIKQDGDKWVLKQTIEGVKMKIDIAGNPISFDSTQPAPPGGANTALSEFFKALVGSEFTLTLGKNMKVEKVEGREEFLKKLSAANQQMEPLLKKILSEDALKQMADPTFGVTPPEGKKAGDKWDNKMTLNLGPIGQYENTYNYTYKGKDEKNAKLDLIEVETNLVYKAPAGETEGLPFKIKSADLKTKDKQTPGVIKFNTEAGRMEESNMSVKLGGTLTIEIGGTATTVELQQDQNTIVKTGDKSFLAEKK